jgi:site-specific recombinase XerD
MKVCDIKFSAMDRQLVLDFLAWLTEVRNSSPSSRNQRLSVLRTFFGYAGELDCTQVALELDIKKIPVAKHPKPMVEFLSESALKALLAEPDTSKPKGLRDAFLMSLMYDTATRVSEIINMKVCDIKFLAKHPVAYFCGKGSKVRSVPVMDKTIEHCRHYLKVFHAGVLPNDDHHLFYTVIHGERHKMSPDTVAQFMKKYGERARKICPEVPERVHPHQLRHTRAIHLYRDGTPLVLVGEYLGHAKTETAKIYAYADAEMKRKAIEQSNAKRPDLLNIAPIWENDEDMILKLSGLQ